MGLTRVRKRQTATASPLIGDVGAVDVLLIDDHEVVRCGLRAVVDRSPHTIVGEAATAEDGLSLCRKLEPHVVMLDVRLEDSVPGRAGSSFELISEILVASPGTRVIVFSAFDNPNYVARALAAGAHDYVLKGEPADMVIEAIETAAAGRPPARAANLRRIVGMMANRSPQDDDDSPLTSRESQVLRQIALGLSNKEIAETLAISVETVKEHVQNLLRKLAVNDRTQAAVWAIRQGIA